MKNYDFWIEQFKKKALPLIYNEFTPIRVLIFGSRVTGNAKEESDIDVIMVSDYFKNIEFIRRMPLVLKTLRFPKHIDILCYSVMEFEKIKESSIVILDALEHGEEVKLEDLG